MRRSNPDVAIGSLIIICGPTASGKTALALELARGNGGGQGRRVRGAPLTLASHLALPVASELEIVNADMGQLYRGMDVGTAKPTAADQKRVLFHLIDRIDPPERFSAGLFRTEAAAAIAAIRERGHSPVVVGGTGLYLKALVHGIFKGPGSDPALRRRLEARVEASGLADLHRELASRDPAAAKRIHPNDRLRLIRALEVIELTGRPISEWQREWVQDSIRVIPVRLGGGIQMFAINWPREELYNRINQRVIQMLEGGWIEETEALFEKWGPDAYALVHCIGYREIIDYLRGRFTRDQLAEAIGRRTRRYAKRQLTWFRADKTIRWISPGSTIDGFA